MIAKLTEIIDLDKPIRQNGFIQIPLLIIIIASVVVVLAGGLSFFDIII